MTLVDLFVKHGGRRAAWVAATAIAGGTLGSGIVALVNLASASDRPTGSLGLGLAFLAALALMFVCNRWAARVTVEIFEDIQHALRERLSAGMRRAPLRTVEQLGGDRGRVIGDLTFVSTVITELVNVLQQGAFVISVTFIIATISGKALLIWCVTAFAIARWLVPSVKRLAALRAQQSGRGGTYHDGLEELFDGFKQVKLDPTAGDELVQGIRAESAALYGGQVQLALATSRSNLYANVIFFTVGLGLATLAPASTVGLGPMLGYEMTILMALSMGPLFGMVQALPAVSQAEASLSAVLDVLGRLEQDDIAPAGDGDRTFETIELRTLGFTYEQAPGHPGAPFTVGPIDLTLRRGQLVFVTGGNGSGKTTLMKMLTGLYPCHGVIAVDGRRITRGEGLGAYRGLFTAIFGGQFLFDRLYGLGVEPERVERLLDRFGITDAVHFDGERFGKLDLSSGQRMRLAMVVALLEDRPICVFDEWTANQDPETTWMYYDTLLPELVAQGRTVIAVSHDDRFFDRADHLIELADGRVRIDRRRGAEPDS